MLSGFELDFAKVIIFCLVIGGCLLSKLKT